MSRDRKARASGAWLAPSTLLSKGPGSHTPAPRASKASGSILEGYMIDLVTFARRSSLEREVAALPCKIALFSMETRPSKAGRSICARWKVDPVTLQGRPSLRSLPPCRHGKVALPEREVGPFRVGRFACRPMEMRHRRVTPRVPCLWRSICESSKTRRRASEDRASELTRVTTQASKAGHRTLQVSFCLSGPRRRPRLRPARCAAMSLGMPTWPHFRCEGEWPADRQRAEGRPARSTRLVAISEITSGGWGWPGSTTRDRCT